MTGYISPLAAGRDGFAQLARAEWTKLRTVPGWIAGLAVMAVTIVGLGLFIASGSITSCMEGNREVDCPEPPLGPEGDAVTDKFYFLSQPLDGDGRLTVRLTGMSGIITYPPPDHDEIVDGLVPWAKAGIMVKENLEPGSSYAAVTATAGHGVRMQHDYKYDTAGKPGRPSSEHPRWLRLDRDGDTITGSESRDGREWTTVETVRLSGLPETVRIGMFVASPGSLTVGQSEFGGYSETMRLAKATGVFDEIDAPGTDWKATHVGVTTSAHGEPHHPGEHTVDDGRYTLSGNGDIAPNTEGRTPEGALAGIWIALIALVVVAVLYTTAEYRRGLIRTTLLASPRRGRVLPAKAVVIGAVTFTLSLVAATATVILSRPILRDNGNYLLPLPLETQVRVVVGAALVLSLTAMLAVAVGALLRRGLPAALTAAGIMTLPFLLLITSVLPIGIIQWLLRVTPAAGFAVMQSVPEYPHVHANYSPALGYYPLPPWAGLAVQAGFTAAALWLAARRLSRSDA